MEVEHQVELLNHSMGLLVRHSMLVSQGTSLLSVKLIINHSRYVLGIIYPGDMLNCRVVVTQDTSEEAEKSRMISRYVQNSYWH